MYGLFCFLNVQQNPNWVTLNGLQQCFWQKLPVKHSLGGLGAYKNNLGKLFNEISNVGNTVKCSAPCTLVHQVEGYQNCMKGTTR